MSKSCPAQNDNLQIHEEKNKGVYVKGLSDFYVGDQADVYNIMKQGGLARAVSSTSESLWKNFNDEKRG